jgi:hypothetical protein
MSEKQDKNIFIDGLGGRSRRPLAIDFPLSKFVLKHKNYSVLFGKNGQTEKFFTSDSKLYLTPEELKMSRRKERIVRIIRRLDSLNARSFERTKNYTVAPENLLTRKLQKQYGIFRERTLELVESASWRTRQKITVVRMWNLSIVGAVIFGMFTMSMIYKYLGQTVSAKIQDNQSAQEETNDSSVGNILGTISSDGSGAEIDTKYITQLLDEEDMTKAALEKKMRGMVAGYPIEKMVSLIAEKDPVVAAFLIGIAKQESDWGKHVPVYQGEECWNYWGFKGKNPVGTGGHTCFASPEDAVDTVAKRLDFLVSNQKRNTPAKMIIWKCGDCSWDNQRDMQSWISAVNMYFQKLNN